MLKGKFDIKAWFIALWQKIRKINPFLLAVIIFSISILLPSEYCLWNQIKLGRKISALEKEKKEIKKQIETNKKNLEEIHSDKWMLEKFAREEFLMKETDEDIFIIEKVRNK